MNELETLRHKADTEEMNAIEWCIYWADLTNTDEESDVPEQAAADLARITAENVELKRLLIEQVGEHGWTNGGDYPDYCRTCENTAKQGHKADCKLDAALKQSS